MFIKEEKIKEISELVDTTKSKPTPQETTDLDAKLKDFEVLEEFEKKPLIKTEFNKIDNEVIAKIIEKLTEDGSDIPRIEEFLREKIKEVEKAMVL